MKKEVMNELRNRVILIFLFVIHVVLFIWVQQVIPDNSIWADSWSHICSTCLLFALFVLHLIVLIFLDCKKCTLLLCDLCTQCAILTLEFSKYSIMDIPGAWIFSIGSLLIEIAVFVVLYRKYFQKPDFSIVYNKNSDLFKKVVFSLAGADIVFILFSTFIIKGEGSYNAFTQPIGIFVPILILILFILNLYALKSPTRVKYIYGICLAVSILPSVLIRVEYGGCFANFDLLSYIALLVSALILILYYRCFKME